MELSSESEIDIDTIQNNENIPKNEPKCKEIYSNPYIYSRILIILVTMFITVLSTFYVIGQRLSLIVDNYWCKSVSLDEVREYNINHGLSEGNSDSCWKTKQYAVKWFFYIIIYSMMIDKKLLF